MFSLKCIICFQSQSIDFKNNVSQADIPSGDPVFIEPTRHFNSGGGKHDVVLRLNKCLYDKAEAARLRYEKTRNGLLDCGFVASKVYPCLFMPKTMICVVYVDDCLFWERSQSDIDYAIKSFKDDGPSYN